MKPKLKAGKSSIRPLGEKLTSKNIGTVALAIKLIIVTKIAIIY